MSDTGLYLNWIPNTLISDEDEEEEEFEPTFDALVGKWKWGRYYFPRTCFIGITE